MLKTKLDFLAAELSTNPQSPPVEVFFRDISQYKYISQNPAAVLNLHSVDFEKLPHPSFSGQKGVLDVSFFYFVRTLENANYSGVSGFLNAVRSLPSVDIIALRVFSHRKNVSIWEIRAKITYII